MKTYNVKAGEIERDWWVVDATDQTLGRLSSKIAQILRGKHKPTYAPHHNCGDYVIVVNAKDIKVSGKKEDEKMYRYYTGYPGGLREKNLKRLRATKPEEIIRHAVKRMLPKNNLRQRLLKNLRYLQIVTTTIRHNSLLS